jgi:2-iminobutanoate/2-iminopropanoate deaminase
VHAVPSQRQGHEGSVGVRQVISAADAPKAMGAYSPAIKAGNLLFVSGQIPIDPGSGELVGGDITVQTEQVMRNLGALLRAAGGSFDHVVRTTVFLADLDDFAAMNEVYSRHVGSPPPARATVQVARLPRGVRIEVDAIAVLS